MCTLMLCVYMNTEATVQVHLDQNWFKSIWTRLGSSPPGPELVHVNLHQNWFKSTWIDQQLAKYSEMYDSKRYLILSH